MRGSDAFHKAMLGSLAALTLASVITLLQGRAVGELGRLEVSDTKATLEDMRKGRFPPIFVEKPPSEGN
eukprot:CAMPEP_0171523106 /NCGR_PEP_ID=MMETSP0959-20130129/8199_1 /TAXON_ID=87120 /ORGANISM="Aurantiochytrium limacinum, Strain ATCCMYA-1381" /LENGTH=68 /DNA_ID=CAMNT_0012063473 /DNA_START=30 /DNA_END=236 /DNA_ORIENTATION=-